MRLRSAALASSILLALAHGACSGRPTAPVPSPSPPATHTYPAGKPDATALENLEYIRHLERLSGRQSDLVFIGGGAKLDGRVSPGAKWRYQFAEGTIRVVEWGVTPTGQVTFLPDAFWSFFRQEKKEIGPSLNLDSPAIIDSAIRNGGRAFIDRFPRAEAKMLYAYLAGLVYAEVTV